MDAPRHLRPKPDQYRADGDVVQPRARAGAGRDGSADAGAGFEPSTVRITAGETVRWENEGQRPGTVTAYEDEIPRGAAYFASGGTKREVAARMLYPLVGALTRKCIVHTRTQGAR